MPTPLQWVLVAAGGALGTVVRLLVSRWVAGLLHTPFPLGTFLVNVTGSFLLGLVGGLIASRAVSQPDVWRLAIGVGFLGGYTTFSTFEYETHTLLEGGAWFVAAANVCLSVFLGLAAVRLGVVAARSWMG